MLGYWGKRLYRPPLASVKWDESIEGCIGPTMPLLNLLSGGINSFEQKHHERVLVVIFAPYMQSHQRWNKEIIEKCLVALFWSVCWLSTQTLCLSLDPCDCCAGALDEDVVVIEATPAPAPAIPASEEINVTSTDSEVEIVTVGDGFR